MQLKNISSFCIQGNADYLRYHGMQAGTLVWEARVVGLEVSYGVEFVPSAEGG